MSKRITFKACKCVVERGQLDVNRLPLECEATWRLLASGLTVGVFQLERHLGQEWSRKARPTNIHQLADLVALLRPGCLESGMTVEYCRVKAGEQEAEYIHPALKPILEETHGCLVYQEQAIRIAVEIAGFSLADADNLRKGIGKKIPEVMAELRTRFIDKAAQKGLVTREQAEEIFGWIEKFQRYGFNRSHAVSYGMIAYQTAWLKCHFPCEFFASYLTFSSYKADPKEEVYKLVQDARLFDLTVLPPDVRRRNVHFEMTEDKKAIAFGLSHVRGVGQSAIEKIITGADLDTWPKFLAAVPQFHRNVGEALIRCGACDGYGLSRNRMIRELEVVLGTTTRDETGKRQEVRGMTAREREMLFERYDSSRPAAEVIEQMVATAKKPAPKTPSTMKKPEIIERLVTLGGDEEVLSRMKKADLVKVLREHPDFENPKTKRLRINEQRQAILLGKAKALRVERADTHLAKSAAEKHHLGVALSCSAVDDADQSMASHTCLDLARSPNGTAVRICAVIDGVRHTRTKRGNNPGQPMCFLNLSDSTYTVDHAVVFPDVYRRFKALCREDFIVLVAGEKRNGSLIVGEIHKLL